MKLKSIVLGLLSILAVPVASAQTQPNLSAQILAQTPSVYLRFNDAGPTFHEEVSGLAFVPSPPPLPNPVSAWVFYGNPDDTGTIGGNTMQPTSLHGTALAYGGAGGFPGQGLSFDLGSSVAQALNTSTADPDGTHPFTYSLWFNSWNLPTTQADLMCNQNGALGFHLSLASGVLEFYLASGGSNAIIVRGTTGIADNSLDMFSVTYDGSGSASGVVLYMNGVALTPTVVQDNLSGSAATTVPMAIGGDVVANGNTVTYNTVIGDVRVYDVAFTTSQMGTLAARWLRGGNPASTVAAQQVGFDPLQVNNHAVALSNAFLQSPNGTMGLYASGNPFSIFAHINNLTAGDKTIAMKDGSWILRFESGNFCYQLGSTGAAHRKCTNASGGFPTGYNYDLVITDVNNGDPGSDTVHIYVNGLEPSIPLTDSGGGVDLGSDGYIYIGGRNGGADTPTQLNVDEFAIMPGIVDQFFVQSEFVHTKFYLHDIGTKPAVPLSVIVDEDGCTDPDNVAALNLAIKAHKLGYINLRAVIDSDVQINSHVFYRDILNANGLGHVPVAFASGSTTSSNPGGPSMCSYFGARPGDTFGTTTLYDAYSANTTTGYPDATPIIRQAIVDLPAGQKMTILSGGSAASIASFMQSPADAISSEDGPTMFANHIQQVFFQGVGNLEVTDSAASSYVLSHNGSVPLYFFDNGDPGTCCTPPSTGPGFSHTRSPKDPLRLLIDAGWGGEVRSGWDSLPTINFLTGVFRGSCTTGTATITAGTSTPPAFTGASAYSWDPSVNSNHYACPLTSLSDPTAGGSSTVFSWFVNSIGNSIAQGEPRNTN